MEIYARHGDLVIQKEALPEGFVLSKPTAPLILAGRETAPHTIASYADVEHGAGGGVQRLRVRRAVKLTHGGRHNTIAIEPGDYVIYPLAEMSGDLARSVED
jgi:hypothetical protein